DPITQGAPGDGSSGSSYPAQAVRGVLRGYCQQSKRTERDDASEGDFRRKSRRKSARGPGLVALPFTEKTNLGPVGVSYVHVNHWPLLSMRCGFPNASLSASGESPSTDT